MEAAMYFKRGRDENYMMRSEKRPGYPQTPPQPNKPKKSVWYQILTILLLILLCPVGLILLWRRKLKWPGAVKLLATLLSLALLFLELGAALWYPFKDERIRAIQHTVSTAIDEAADASREWLAGVGENWDAVVDNGREIGAAAGNHALGQLLDAIASPTPVPTQIPPMSLTAGGKDSAAIDLLNATATPSPTPTASPTPTPSPTPTAAPTQEPTQEPTSAAEPAETGATSANVLERPTPSSGVNPSLDGSATPVPPVTPTPSPTATPVATATPTPSPEPTIDPASIPRLEEPGDTLVWHTSNGKWYHKASKCGTMSNASQHTLSSAVKNGKTACPYCYPIDSSWAREDEPTVYVSTDNYWHTRSGCESNTDEWTPMLLENVLDAGSFRPCDACGARHYVNGVPAALTGSGETSGETAVQATAEPEPTGKPALTAAGDTLVWHTSNGKWYHKASKCGTMSNASQHTLSSAVKNGKSACPYCHPIEEKWAKETSVAAYVSTDKHWHVSDSCKKNTSDWTVMLLDAARTDASLTACTACGADQYAGGAAEIPAVTPEETVDEQSALNLNEVTNGDTVVYYSNNTSHYHRRDKCASSATTTFVPHKLMDALLEGKMACPVCEPDEPVVP